MILGINELARQVIDHAQQAEIEQYRRKLWDIPDEFAGSVSDWLHLQGFMMGESFVRGMAAGIRFRKRLPYLPFGARAQHRKDLKRKHRKAAR